MIEMTEQRRRQLDEIVDLMNKEKEMQLLFEEGSKEWKHANEVLLSLKRFVDNLEEHERGYVETGLMDHKDVHATYGHDYEHESLHQREKYARLDGEGKERPREGTRTG
jgi:predicted hydrolase (HD superfamily)